jgi:hypothetical protein
MPAATPKRRLLKRIEGAMANNPTRPHQLAEVGYDLGQFLLRFGESNESLALVGRYKQTLHILELDDLADQQMAYARRLTDYPGKLEYEEVRKLFSLADEIATLMALNLPVNAASHQEYEQHLRLWCSQESTRAQLVAEDLVENWKRHWWWYSDNLS